MFGGHTQREGVSLEERRWGRTTREMSRKGALTWNSCDGRACRPPKTSAPGGRVSGRRRRCCWECSAWLPQPLRCLSARTGSASTCDRGRCSQEGGQGGDIRGRGKMESNGGGGRSYTESGFEDVDCSFCLASYIYLVILFLEFKWKHNLIKSVLKKSKEWNDKKMFISKKQSKQLWLVALGVTHLGYSYSLGLRYCGFFCFFSRC